MMFVTDPVPENGNKYQPTSYVVFTDGSNEISRVEEKRLNTVVTDAQQNNDNIIVDAVIGDGSYGYYPSDSQVRKTDDKFGTTYSKKPEEVTKTSVAQSLELGR